MPHTQPFDDIIIETLAKTGANKTFEIRLFWLLTLAAVLISFVAVKLISQKSARPAPKRLPVVLYCIPVLLLPNICHFIIFQTFSKPLAVLLVLALLYHVLFRDLCAHYLAFTVLTYYALMGISTLLCVLGIAKARHVFLIAAILGFGVSLLCRLCKKEALINRLLLYVQPFITLVLVLYFVDSYLYQGTRIKVPYAPFYDIFFAALLAIFILLQLFFILRRHTNATALPLSALISRISVITIFIYNSYSACPMFAQPDQHHHGEQMIPWQQVFEMGQKLYQDYTPVSGLFPMVIGFIQNNLLGGTISDYSPAVSIFMVLICMLTMYLLYEHVGGSFALVFSVLFCLPCYNRQYLVLPLLLLLTLPALLAQKREWLLAWIMGSFLAGLYYPLFGAAVMFGMLPLAIVQFHAYLKQPRTTKPVLVILEYMIVFVPILACVPLLYRMFIHTLTYSNQTTLADGIALRGQSVPTFFMPYLSQHATLQKLCYFGLRFSLPLIAVVLFCIMIFKAKQQLHRLLYLSGAITLCVSYTYTLVRADTDVILSRTSYILVALLGMYLPALLLRKKEGGDVQPVSYPTFLLIGLLVSLPSILYQNVSAVKTPAMWVYPNGESMLYFDDEAKLFDAYDVHELFVKSEDTGLSTEDKARLGSGFMVKDQLDYVKHYRKIIDKCSAFSDDLTYYGFDGQGFYAYLGVKCCYSGYIPAAKGYNAQQVIIQKMKETRPIVFLLDEQSNYYIYYYVMTNDYVYDEEDDCYYPQELYQKLYPKRKLPAQTRAFDTISPTELGNVPDSFGKSFDTLKPLMTKESEFTFHFPGTDYDMLYIKLDTSSILDAAAAAGVTAPNAVTVDFAADGERYPGSHITCHIGDGTLLIPVGMNACWLQAKDISHISLSFNSDANSSLYAPCIREMKLYKIRQ